MASYFTLTVFLHFFIICFVSHKFLRSIGCPLNCLSVIPLNLELIMSNTTLQLSEIVPFSQSSSLSNKGLFQ